MKKAPNRLRVVLERVWLLAMRLLMIAVQVQQQEQWRQQESEQALKQQQARMLGNCCSHHSRGMPCFLFIAQSAYCITVCSNVL